MGASCYDYVDRVDRLLCSAGAISAKEQSQEDLEGNVDLQLELAVTAINRLVAVRDAALAMQAALTGDVNQAPAVVKAAERMTLALAEVQSS